ncbi:hypothetical protein [Leptodesmis sp.]
MTLAMSQEIDFLVVQRVFRRFVSQPGLVDQPWLTDVQNLSKDR